MSERQQSALGSFLPITLTDLSRLVGFSLAYFVLGLGGMASSVDESAITGIWPPIGLSMAVLFLYGYQQWPGVVIGLTCTMFATGSQHPDMGWTILGNVLGPMAGVWVLKRLDFRSSLERIWDLWILLGMAGILASVVCTGFAGVPRAWANIGGNDSFPEDVFFYQIWFLGDYVGIIVFCPLIVAFQRGVQRSQQPILGLEGIGLFAILGGLFSLMYLFDLQNVMRGLPFIFFIFPITVWAALRFGLRVVTLVHLVALILLVVGYVTGRGPFRVTIDVYNPLVMSFFLISLSTTGLFLAVANEGRNRAEERVGRQLRFFRRVLNSLPNAVLVKEADSRVAFANEGWSQIRGVPAEKLEGQMDYDLEDLDREIWRVQDRQLLERPDQTLTWEKLVYDHTHKRQRHMSFLKRVILLEDEINRGVLVQMHDQTGIYEAREKLRLSEARLKAAIEGADIGLWQWDVERRKFERDPSWYRVMGFRPEDFSESRDAWHERVHPDDKNKVIRFFREKVGGPSSYFEIEYRLRHRDGNYIWVNSRAFVTERDVIGKPKRVMGIIINITPQKLAEFRIIEAKEAAESANRAKSYFLANISHEIRTPLNAIMGMTSIMEETPLSDEQADFLRTIRASGSSLATLISDVLDFSKIESGKFELDPQEFPLRLCCEEALTLFRKNVKDSGVDLRMEFDPTLEGYFRGDPNRIRQILYNLVGNAVKFTRSGHICLKARPADLQAVPERIRLLTNSTDYLLDHPTPCRILIEVEDSGPGIASDRHDKIFESFTQGDASTTREYGGTGLGLAICKSLAEAMGGGVWVESEPGKGSTFSVLLKLGREVESLPPPRDSGDTPPPGETPPTGPRPKLASEAPCRILIVEDNATNRLVLSSLLKRFGYSPAAVSSGEEAIDVLEHRVFDLVFMDIRMSGKDGLETTREIRKKLPRDRQPVIVAVTAHAIKGEREKCILSGMDDFITKPIHSEHLEAVLKPFRSGEAVRR